MLENPRYKTADIKQGLVSIRKNQIQLLQELRSEHEVLKGYTPTPISLIRQESAESLEVSKQVSNAQQNLNRFGRKSQLITSISLGEIMKINENLEKENKFLHREKQLIQQDYEQMKKNYYNEKHRLKETTIHIEFSEGMLLSIMKDVINKQKNDLIITKISKELSTFKIQYPEYNDYSIQQTVKMLKNAEAQGLHKRKSQKQHKNISKNKQFQFDTFFSPKNSEKNLKRSFDYEQLLIQKETQIDRKNSQIQQLKHRIRSLEDELMTISAQRKMKILDLQRYKNQVRNLDDSISEQINCKRQLQALIKVMQEKQRQLQAQIAQKDTKLTQIQKQLSIKFGCQKQRSLQNISQGNLNIYSNNNINSPKSTERVVIACQNTIPSVSNIPLLSRMNQNVQISSGNVNSNMNMPVQNPQIKRVHEVNKFLSQQNNMIKRSLNELQQKIINLVNQKNRVDQMMQNQVQRLTAMNISSSRRYQQQILSMNSQIDLLKQEYHALIQQVQELRQKENNSKGKCGSIKIDKVVQHLWEIKNVQLDNLKQFLSSVRENPKRKI